MYNSQNNEIPEEIINDIQDILKIKPGQKLSRKHIKNKKDELQSLNLEALDSTAKYDFKM